MSTQIASPWNEGVVGKQLLGFPGSKVTAVKPTGDYLVNGPVGDGWYDAAEGRYVTTDFVVTATLADGRDVSLPKSYAWVADQKSRPDDTCTTGKV